VLCAANGRCTIMAPLVLISTYQSYEPLGEHIFVIYKGQQSVRWLILLRTLEVVSVLSCPLPELTPISQTAALAILLCASLLVAGLPVGPLSVAGPHEHL
jgi:hypothetical protein